MRSKIYIITRFNAPCFPTRKDLAERRLDDTWLRERVRLFKKYCYPSVMNQSFQYFDWIVWCHPDSPDWLIRELTALENSNIKFIFTGSYYPYLDTDVDTLVTVRLDNDDMILEDFMMNIACYIPTFQMTGLPRQVYSFTNGYRYYDVSTPKVLRKTLRPDSRFIPEGSLIEAKMHNNPFLTLFANLREKGPGQNFQPTSPNDHLVYYIDHAKMTDIFPTVYNNDLAAWAWVYHESNTASIKVEVGAKADAETILKEFGVGNAK